jgi:ATP-dependent helicase/nuclease subunit A
VKIRDALDPTAPPDPRVADAARVRERRAIALEDLDSAPIGTIHSFCTAILRRLPIQAGIPPLIQVEDTAQTDIGFAVWWREQQRTVIDSEHADTVTALLGAGMGRTALRKVARSFHDHWDRVETWLEDTPVDGEQAARDAVSTLVRMFEDIAREPVTATNATAEKITRLVAENRAALEGVVTGSAEELRSGPADLCEVLGALALLRDLRPSTTKVWGPQSPEIRERCTAFNEQIVQARSAVVQALAEPVVRTIAHAVLDQARDRCRSGRLQYHDLLVLTRRLLVGPSAADAHALLHEQLRWILVDEFQDTDPLQAEILFRLAATEAATAATGTSNPADWQDLPLRPGQLFMVGDPQQSIYRFRGADIGVFTAVAGALGRQAPLADGTPSVVAAGLSTNFRSDPDMLDWVNAAFGTLIREETGIQPAFQALDVRPDAPAPRSDAAVRTSVPRSEEGLLPPLSKAREAALARASAGPTSASATPAAGPAVFSFDAATDEGGIGTAQNAARAIAHLVQDPPQVTAKKNLQATAGPLRPQDVAVLLRSRGPLAALEDALDGLGIEYRAEASTLIYATTEVRELKLILQAVANTADSGRLALALRTSILGCGDDDLASWKLAGGSWNIHARLPESLGTAAQQPPHPVARALAELQDLARLARVQTPADLLEHLVDTHLVHAVVTDSPRHRDLSRRLTYVIDQARAWFADTHGSLRDYLDWIDREDTDQAQDSETVLDEQDSSAVRILTVHAAKGLEFPAVVLLTGTQTRNDRPAVHWDQDTVPHLHLGSGLESTGYEDAHTREKYALDSEILRLMYVGCTRAEHLLLLPRYPEDKKAPMPLGPFLDLVSGRSSPDRPGYDLVPVPVPEFAGVMPAAADAPTPLTQVDSGFSPLATWENARDTWQRASARPATASVTSRAHGPDAGGTTDPGDAVGTPAGVEPGAPVVEPEIPAATTVPLGGDSAADDHDAAPLLTQGTTFGTALHRALELTRLDPDADVPALVAQACAEAGGRAGAGAAGAVLDQERLIAMARFALGTAPMRQAAGTGRHWFELDVSGADADDVLLVGRADFVYLDEQGRVCIVDFKSDVNPSPRRVQEYGVQVRSYLDLICRVTGTPRGAGFLLFAAPELARVDLV